MALAGSPSLRRTAAAQLTVSLSHQGSYTTPSTSDVEDEIYDWSRRQPSGLYLNNDSLNRNTRCPNEQHVTTAMRADTQAASPLDEVATNNYSSSPSQIKTGIQYLVLYEHSKDGLWRLPIPQRNSSPSQLHRSGYRLHKPESACSQARP